MRVNSLNPREPSLLLDALVRRGLDPVRAEAAARGLIPVALMFEPVDAADRNVLAEAARGHDLECLTGDGWVLIAGSAAALAGLARAGLSRLDPRIAEEAGGILRSVLEVPRAWEMARGTVGLEHPVVVGILNVTPDSFSDGGQFFTPADAARRAEELLVAGADVLDIGAESTRPGADKALEPAEEWGRLEPVLADVARRFPEAPVSVDTVNGETGRRALEAGAWALNDVSGLRLDADIAAVCAEHGAGLILAHSRGAFDEMASYDHAEYGDVTVEVVAELERSIGAAVDRGVRAGSMVLDPGLGFAKRPEHNYALLRGLPALASLGFPVMVGPSRKRFLSHVTETAVSERDNATAAACVAAYERGAVLFRVHDVARAREALQVAQAVREP